MTRGTRKYFPLRAAATMLAAVVAACSREMPNCTSTQAWYPAIRMCVGICGTREAPASSTCFDSDSGSFVPTAQDAANDGSSDSSTDGSDARVAADDAGSDGASSDAADASMSVIDPMIEAPRPVSPLSTSRATSQRPTLRWNNATTTDGAMIELSRTRDFRRIEQQFSSTGNHAAVSSTLPAGVWFWRLRGRDGSRNATGTTASPVWWFRIGARSADALRDHSWGTELDMNGDGFSDIAIGSPAAEGSRGRVDVFYGSTAGLPATPSVTLRGAAPGDRFGASVASGGDVNGDGFADLIVGSPGADPVGRANAGTASVFLGSASGASADPARVLNGNADSDEFGGAVSSAGDVNGDGFADIIVGAVGADPGGRNNAGTASVYYGSSEGVQALAARVLEGSVGDGFGFAVAGVGDVNGDSFADVAVGTRFGSPAGRMNAGSVSVFHGSATGLMPAPARVLEGAVANDQFGYSVAGALDVNGDGLSELIVGAYSADPGGRMFAGVAYVYLGTSSGIGELPSRMLDGASAFDSFAFAVASAGDIDADGFDDVVAGAPFATPMGLAGAGTAAVFRGGPGGITVVPSRVIDGIRASERFGHSVRSVGDINGDGFIDIAIGAPAATPSGRTAAGAVRVYSGSATGIAATPVHTLEGAAAADNLGQSIAQTPSHLPSRLVVRPRLRS